MHKRKGMLYCLKAFCLQMTVSKNTRSGFGPVLRPLHKGQTATIKKWKGKNHERD